MKTRRPITSGQVLASTALAVYSVILLGIVLGIYFGN